MDGNAQFKPTSVEDIFMDFKGRRAGIIKALTTDFKQFHLQCDPEKDNLFLYGFPDEQWIVDLPAKEVPQLLPEPALGINYARDEMNEKDWISFVALRCDTWLLSMAFFFSARSGLDKTGRARLFALMNDLPTISEVAVEHARKHMKERTSISNKSSIKFKVHSKGEGSKSGKHSKGKNIEEYEDDTICGACGQNYTSDGFWIFCDSCEKWFHGICVEITPAQAELIENYICSSCHHKLTT